MSDKPDTKFAISDFNLQVISTSEYAEVLSAAIQSGANVAAFGRRGSGKTEICKQAISEAKIDWNGEKKSPKEIYINLSTAERTDMGGYPDMFSNMNKTKEEKDRFINFMLPNFFESMMTGNTPVIAVLDEVDKADSSILAPLLEILQFKSINGRPLKNLHACILTGNLISEGSQRPSLPLLDRAEKYLLMADTSAFLSWAAKTNKIHPSIRSFLNDKANYLYGSNDGGGDLYAEPSPRSWENASKALFYGEKNGWSKELMNRKVAGYVGKQAGIEYDIYFTHYRELLPLVDKVFEGKNATQDYKDKNPGMQTYAAMIICSRLASILDKVEPDANGKRTKPKELSYVGKFFKNAVSDENILISVRTQLTLKRVMDWGLDSDNDWSKTLIDITNLVNQ